MARKRMVMRIFWRSSGMEKTALSLFMSGSPAAARPFASEQAERGACPADREKTQVVRKTAQGRFRLPGGRGGVCDAPVRVPPGASKTPPRPPKVFYFSFGGRGFILLRFGFFRPGMV